MAIKRINGLYLVIFQIFAVKRLTGRKIVGITFMVGISDIRSVKLKAAATLFAPELAAALVAFVVNQDLMVFL